MCRVYYGEVSIQSEVVFMTGGDFSCVESSYREDSLHRRLCMTGGYDLGCVLPPSESVRVGFVDVGALNSVCTQYIGELVMLMWYTYWCESV